MLNATIVAIPANTAERIFIKQRYIGWINNVLILA